MVLLRYVPICYIYSNVILTGKLAVVNVAFQIALVLL